MEYVEEEVTEPVSPTGQYLNSEALSLCVLGILESGVPIAVDDSQVESLVHDVFLPTNPRFCATMVVDENGEKRWKKVEVKIKDHIKNPIFPSGMSTKFYDKYVDDYISKIALEKLPETQPLWEIHMIRYPTSNNAAGTVIFKLHHSLGDGFSLVGALLSCLQRADDPSLPLTFPSAPLMRWRKNSDSNSNGLLKNVFKIFSVVTNTVSDFCSSFMKSNFLEDEPSPIRSGHEGVEFLPITTATTTLNLDQVKQIKANLGATVNDVVGGVILLGTRLYMKEVNSDSGRSNSTTLMLFNTRQLRSYVPVKDMVKPEAKTPWGNYFAFLHVPIPKLDDDHSNFSHDLNPLDFVCKTRDIIDAKKTSLAVHLTGRFLQILKNLRGPEAAARYIHGTLKKSSMTTTNVVGPVEQMALANHPITGIYFVVVGAPQSLSVTVISYMRELRVVVAAEKDFIDAQKLKSCIENAFEMIFEAACKHN